MKGAVRGRADIHMHSTHSDGVASVRRILDHVENRTDLDLIAITDHDTMDGYYEAVELMKKRHYRFDLLAGLEISTSKGHLLAFGLKKPVKPYMDLLETVIAVHKKGGVCIVPHPMAWMAGGISRAQLMRILKNGSKHIYIDGVETLNSTFAGWITQATVNLFNYIYLKSAAETGGSDSHTLGSIGTSYTSFDGTSAADFLKSLKQKKTRAEGRFMNVKESVLVMKERNFFYSKIYKPFIRHHIRGYE